MADMDAAFHDKTVAGLSLDRNFATEVRTISWITCRGHSATNMYGLHHQAHAQGSAYAVDGIEARMRAGAQRFVQRLACNARFLGYIAHTSGTGNIPQRRRKQRWVVRVKNVSQEGSDRFLAVEIRRRVECRQIGDFDAFWHDQSSNCAANFLARLMSLCCVRLEPPDDNLTAALSEVHAPARANVDAQLVDALADRLDIAQQPELQPLDARHNDAAHRSIGQAFEPSCELRKGFDHQHEAKVIERLQLVNFPLDLAPIVTTDFPAQRTHRCATPKPKTATQGAACSSATRRVATDVFPARDQPALDGPRRDVDLSGKLRYKGSGPCTWHAGGTVMSPHVQHRCKAD